MGKKKGGELDGLKDERFSRIKSDPIFSGLKNSEKKVVIDKRFAAALTDEKFSARSKVDMRGRKQKKTLGNDLLDVYELEEEKEEKKDEVDDFFDESDDNDEEDEEDEEEEEEEAPTPGKTRIDLARGEGNVESSSDDDSSDEEEDGDAEIGEGEAGGIEMSNEARTVELDLAQLDQDVEQVEWVSKRLAICNLEWEHVNCEDILMLVKSFVPEGGHVETVAIYLSDFGEEQLALEEKQGPLVKLPKPLEEYKEGELSEESRSAVRKYLMDRLKYYYAVVQFDSEQSASAVYEQCDGFQFEETGLKMDLRFIPDEMEFEKEREREFLNATNVNVNKYKPKKKPKNSIASTNSKIAWDEDDPSRSRKLLKAFDGDENAAKDLIADSDGSDDEGGDEKNRRTLMDLLKTEEKKEGLDVEWEGDKEGSEEGSDGEYQKIEDSEEDEEEEKKKEEKKNGYQSYLEKRKEKRTKMKLAKRKGGKLGEENDSTIKSAEIVENVVKDDRFSALFTDNQFAIEPSSKKFKHSLLATKQAEKKAEAGRAGAAGPADTPAKSEDLVKKLKMKTEKWKSKK